MPNRTYYTAPPSVVSRAVADELVLVDLDSERYFSLNRTGAAIWDELSSKRSCEEAVARVVRDFEVDEATARADLEELVASLLNAGLLLPGG